MAPRRRRPGWRVRTAAALLVLAGLAAAPGADAACAPPQRLGEVAIDLVHNNTPLVTVQINGRPAVLTLDTGAERTVLTTAAASRLGIPAAYSYPRPMHGIGGAVGGGEIALRSFTAGQVQFRRVGLVVGAITLPPVDGRVADGLLGVDTLADFDLDLDLPNRRLVFYKRQDCPDSRPAWPQRANRIPAGESRHRHLFFPVLLDGHRLVAFFDTGSQINVIATAAARAIGISAAMLAHDPARTTRGVAAEVMTSHAHRFDRLQVGSESVRNPVLTVADIHLDNETVVLGAGFLSARRLWISYGSRQLFLWQVP